MTPMVYKWKAGVRAPLPARVFGDRLDAIRTAHNGRMTPAHIVDDARPVESVLHPAFEWNDAVAAEKYRQEQAGALIRKIIVEIAGDDGEEPKMIRAFVSITEDGHDHYTSTMAAMSDDALRVQILKKAWDELQAWKKKYDELTEFAAVFSAMNDVHVPQAGLG